MQIIIANLGASLKISMNSALFDSVCAVAKKAVDVGLYLIPVVFWEEKFTGL